MAAKKKSSPKEQWDQAVKSGAIRPLKNAPAESFTAPGKSPSTQGVKTTSLPTPKTPVKKAGEGFAGSGGTLASGFKKPSAGDIANAALTVTVAPGAKGPASLVRGIAKFRGARAFETTANAAYTANMKGLMTATGEGGKVSRTMTPFGPSLRSTSIGSPAQQAARINNLEVGAIRKATRAGNIVQTEKIIQTVKAANKIKKAGVDAATAYIGIRGMKRK
jgi:hypothetical protein